MEHQLQIQAAELRISQPNIDSSSRAAISFRRVFSTEGCHPFDRVSWTTRDATITNEKGESVFEQKGVKVPESWSQMATNVVVSKYFHGAIGSSERETSVAELVSRVANTITKWGMKDGYFSDKKQAEIFNHELIEILLGQLAAFNSPVWFNVGIEEQPQCSACFILSVEDEMSSLLELQKAEGLLFKYGSGAGSNLSNIRSSKEKLRGGGTASGPVSFMKGFDAWAGTIKSGGKTRRAAKMQILDCDHPDIIDFIDAKRLEEEKAWALIEQGYSGGFNVPGGAYDSVFFQNSNLSVRITDDFMNAVLRNEKYPTTARRDGSVVEMLDARTVLRAIAKGTWVCGDPGVQFDTRINEWHTCPNSGRINASNPCSEYMSLDDSACNLASINLLKFLRHDGTFDTAKYRHVVEILVTAQDILIDNSSYPTSKISENAKKFRQIGLGFANLGALLMSKGLGYDSDEGRALASNLMAILCGQAYLTSSKLAETLDPFEGYAENEFDMLRVMRMHSEETDSIPPFISFESLKEESKNIWQEALRRGELFGFRNSQATVLAPTGTIAFLMDCDTTGIEPDIALVKYKKLIGGGFLKIVNNSVGPALISLGYSDSEIEIITKFIEERDTIEGAPGLKEEHLSIFDCAFKPLNGTRSINWSGHVRMMAACQPFVSGAISKTVNLPESATIDDIFETYVAAWRLGIKAIAIYRDNSKRSQPLGVNNDQSSDADKSSSSQQPATRRHLADEREAITHKFNIAGHEGYLTVGLFEDGSPGEIFIVMAKEGSTLSGVMDAFATSISTALQYGVPLSKLVQKFSHMRFEPSGLTTNKQIPFAKSILDYVFRYLGSRFLPIDEQKSLGILNPVESHGRLLKPKSEIGQREKKPEGLVTFELSDDAPPCSSCGSSLMVRQGSCYRCLICGSQGGCG